MLPSTVRHIHSGLATHNHFKLVSVAVPVVSPGMVGSRRDASGRPIANAIPYRSEGFAFLRGHYGGTGARSATVDGVISPRAG